jgi:CheY-like chemotaxis protein
MTSRAAGYILVVEDDAGVRNGIAQLIESEGYSVVSCEDARAALDRLAAATDMPRMIVLDFLMPRMDGWAFLEERNY